MEFQETSANNNMSQNSEVDFLEDLQFPDLEDSNSDQNEVLSFALDLLSPNPIFGVDGQIPASKQLNGFADSIVNNNNNAFGIFGSEQQFLNDVNLSNSQGDVVEPQINNSEEFRSYKKPKFGDTSGSSNNNELFQFVLDSMLSDDSTEPSSSADLGELTNVNFENQLVTSLRENNDLPLLDFEPDPILSVEETLQADLDGIPTFLEDDNSTSNNEKSVTGAATYLCPVCGNQNGRHAHYGGYSCPSCRAFFRRSVQTKAYKTFKCSIRNCKINSQSWRSCKWCRFQRCLQSGMKPEWVLDKNERHSKNEKRSFSEMEAQVLPSLSSEPNRMLTLGFTNNELLQILSHVDCRKMNMSNSLLHFYSSNPSLFKELASTIYKKSILPFKTYQHLESKWPCTMEDFVIKDSELGQLSDFDSSRLLQANFPILQIFIQSVVMINSQHFKATPLGNLLKRSITISPYDGDKQDLEVLSQVLQNLKIQPSPTQGGISYDQVFASPWADCKELEERHSQLTKEMSAWPVNQKDPAKHVDKVQLFLLANIIMLTADNVKVNNYTKVNEIQNKYLMMLHRYLKYKYKEGYNTAFAKGLMMSSLAKEAKEIRSHRLPV